MQWSKKLVGPITGLMLVMLWTFSASLVDAGVDYSDPPGGWDYTYDGVGDAFTPGGAVGSLDGTWQNGPHDQWDGSAPGDPIPANAPGGAAAYVGDVNGTDQTTTYLRVQDTGDPNAPPHNFPKETSNRQVWFGHAMTQEAPDLDPAVLDNGITLSFRARIATAGVSGRPLDDEYPENTGTLSWPSGGIGYPVNGGEGMFGVSQTLPNQLQNQIAFSLATEANFINFAGKSGLVMNNTDAAPGSDTDAATTDEMLNLIPISAEDLADWHEFWITVQTDQSLFDVQVFMDGSADPDVFQTLVGTDVEYKDAPKTAYLLLGLDSGSRMGAFDVDFLSYKLGVFTPINVLLGDVNLDGEINGLDVAPFVTLVTDGTFQAEGDMNEDGQVNGLDVDPFVQAVVGGGASAVPEPATLGLALLAFSVLACSCRRSRRWPER